MSVLLFIIILLILIVAHEFGHFIIAKSFGIRVDEFGIGFPPKALTITKKNGTEYTLNWIPFGGFVRIFGENPDDESINGPDKERSFVHKPPYVKFAVLVGGVLFNILLAWILLSSMLMIGTDIVISEDERPYASNIRLVVSGVLPESPAEKVGLVPGDIIVNMESSGSSISNITPDGVVEFIGAHSESQIDVFVERSDEIKKFIVTPETQIISEDKERAVLGISMGSVGFLQYKNPIKALIEGGKFTGDLTTLVFDGIISLFAGIFTFNADFSDVAGPIGIVGVVGDAASAGIVSLIFLTALISINLAVINAMPIPALDGGRIFFLIIETLKGSPIKPQIANAIHASFFVLLLLLIVVISYFDIARLIS